MRLMRNIAGELPSGRADREATERAVRMARQRVDTGTTMGMRRAWFANPSQQGPNPDEGRIVTVYRAQPRRANNIITNNSILLAQSDIVTRGRFLRGRESGDTLTRAFNRRNRLLNNILNSSGTDRVTLLEAAQRSGNRSPFISTSFDRAGTEAAAQDLLNFYDQSELIVIRGPISGGINFEAEFERLGGRVSSDRTGDAAMREFGIIDLFIPPTGTSSSGFAIVDRIPFTR
jgi:hypothetical protein